MCSTPLFVASIGTRWIAVQLTPSVDVVKTMSFDEQPRRNRQSCHATKTLPAASISAEGSGPVRSEPATVWCEIAVTVVVADQVAPPFVDRNACSAVSLALSIGTTTVPFGWTSGWPPMPVALFAVARRVLHVSPPSVETLM